MYLYTRARTHTHTHAGGRYCAGQQRLKTPAFCRLGPKRCQPFFSVSLSLSLALFLSLTYSLSLSLSLSHTHTRSLSPSLSLSLSPTHSSPHRICEQQRRSKACDELVGGEDQTRLCRCDPVCQHPGSLLGMHIRLTYKAYI